MLGLPFIGNMPMPIDAAVLRSAFLDAHALGPTGCEQVGDDASYRRLHGC